MSNSLFIRLLHIFDKTANHFILNPEQQLMRLTGQDERARLEWYSSDYDDCFAPELIDLEACATAL